MATRGTMRAIRKSEKIEKIRSTLSLIMDRGQRERVMMPSNAHWKRIFLILNLARKSLSGTILFSSQ